MSKLFLSSINGNQSFERDYENTETVNDIKLYILNYYKNVSEAPNEKEAVKIIFNGKIVAENVPLGSLCCEGDLFMKYVFHKNNENRSLNNLESKDQKSMNTREYINKSNKCEEINENKSNALEIEMNNVERQTRVRILRNGEKMMVDPSKIITINNQMIYVTKREKKQSVVEELRNAIYALKMELVIKVAVIIALFMTSNTEFAMILTGILILRGVSNLKFKIKMKDENICFVNRFLLSFFVSMFLMNSDYILDFTEVKEKKCV